MATHFWRDTSETTANIFSKLIKNNFPLLKKANFIFVLRDNEKTDDEGNIIAGEARKISGKERDLWGFDFEICLDAEIWSKMNKADKYRLGFHELCHCGVETEEGSTEPKFDDNGKLKTKIIKHDIWLKTFKQEIETFGFDGTDQEVATVLSEMMDNKAQIKKNKKEFLAKMGIEINKEVGETEVKKKKKKNKHTEIEISTKKKSKEELEEEADKLLGLDPKKKKKDRLIEIDMKKHNRKKFGKKK
jgi:hypothetical protein